MNKPKLSTTNVRNLFTLGLSENLKEFDDLLQAQGSKFGRDVLVYIRRDLLSVLTSVDLAIAEVENESQKKHAR